MNAAVLFRTLDEVFEGSQGFSTRESLSTWYGPPLTPEMVTTAEAQLGIKLPKAYIDLLTQINGGFLVVDWLDHPNAPDSMQLGHLPGLGHEQGMDAPLGSKYMSEEWGYPAGLVYVSGDGHTGFFFDYRTCGPMGEPGVVWLDTECDDPEEYMLTASVDEFLQFLEERSIVARANPGSGV